MTLSVQAEFLPELIRPLAFDQGDLKTYPLRKIFFNGEYSEGYIYSDCEKVHFKENLEDKLFLALEYFDKVVYPRFQDLFYSHIENKRKHSQSKIILLFDCKLSHSAYHSRTLFQKYRRDFILINIDENFDSNFLKYKFPHELQHLMRYHFNSSELPWLDEGLSVFATFLMTEEFPIKYLESYNHLEGRNLFFDYKKINSSENYFNNFFYIFYLYRHYGGLDLIKKLMNSEKSGYENINNALSSLVSTNKEQKKFFNFEKSFINYQLALILNPYKNKIESDNFFDLELESANVNNDNTYFGVASGILPLNKIIALPAVTSNYYELDKKCIQIEFNSDSKIFPVFIDMQNKNPNKAFQVMVNHKTYCLDQVYHSGQYLVIINPDPDGQVAFALH